MAAAEHLTDAAAPAPVKAKPNLGTKLAYSIGQTAQSGGFDGALGFVFFYYTAVLGLAGSLVGAALAVSLAFDSVVDPVVGSWSDGIRSRFGRRLPPMLISIPLTALALGLLFAPPAGLSQPALFAWLTVGTVAVRSFISLFNVPYFALGGEMSDDYVERSSIVAWRAVAGIVVGIGFTAMAFAVFFTGANGLQRATAYPAYGWTVAAVVSAASLVCCLGLLRYAARLPSPPVSGQPLWRRMPGEMAEIFRNRSFRVLFISAVVFYVAVGVNATLNSHAAVFVWRLKSNTIQLLSYAYLAGILAGIALTPALSRRMEKKTAVLIGLAIVAVSWTALPGLRALEIIRLTGDAALGPLIANGLFVGLGVGFCAVAYPSMMADAAEEHEYLSGTRREGLYFAGLGFAAKAASGLGVLVGGFALDLIGFPKDVAGKAAGSIPGPVLDRLMAAHGPAAALIGLISMAIFAPYAISRARHAVISQALRERRIEGPLPMPDGVAPGA